MKGFFPDMLKIASSVLCAAALYLLWMGAFIVLSERTGPVIRGVLWVLAPVVTAAGFALGVAAAERLLRSRSGSFARIFPWPLAGCAVGAAAVYWYGPMLIVFGMFLLGTASVVLRQVLLGRRRRDTKT
jgi:hypothetical protein